VTFVFKIPEINKKNSFSCLISFQDSVMSSQTGSHIKYIKSTDVTETDSLSIIIVLIGA